MTSPVLAEVARRYPQTQMVVLTRGFYEPFFDGIPNLTFHNIDLADYHRGGRGLLRLYGELRKAHPDVEMVVDLQDKIYSKFLRKFYFLRGIPSRHIDKGRAEKKALTAMPDKGKVMRPLRTSWLIVGKVLSFYTYRRACLLYSRAEQHLCPGLTQR